MTTKLPPRYNEKASDSFRTKIRLYMFSKALNNNWQSFGLDDFRHFEINEDLVITYTTEYWQYEPEYEIRPGLSINQIMKDLEHKEKELALQIEAFRQDYIYKTFFDKYPVEDFQKLIDTENCVYCGITIPKVIELANNQKLYKKNYRGWTLEIDRKDSNLEYSPDNCVMACYWCNNAKTDEFTHEEFLKVGKVIREIWQERLINT